MPDGGHSFKDDITDWDVQCKAFQKWADEMLPGILNVACTFNFVLTIFPAVPEPKAPDTACPIIICAADDSPLLPHVDLTVFPHK
jgi:hypothetical protein